MTRTALSRRATSSLAATFVLALGVGAAPASALINTDGSNSRELRSGLAWGSIPQPDRIAAERAAANQSASLDRFALIHVRTIPSTAPVRPNPDEQTPVTAAQGAGPHPEVIGRGGRGFSATPAPIVRVNTPSGFDWGDAGIGAAVGIAVSMLVLGLPIVVFPRRVRRAKAPAAVAN